MSVDRVAIGTFERGAVLEAHVTLFGSFYNFGLSYDKLSDGTKVSQGTQDYFDLLSK